MINLCHIYSRLIKKYLRGKSIVNCTIDKSVVIGGGSTIYSTSIGRYSYCGYDCNIFECVIGSFCSIASDVTIGGAEHPIEWVSTSPVFEDTKNSGPKKRFAMHPVKNMPKTIIGSDVWIGSKAIIKSGVRIGIGAVIGAGAVVTKDIEPYTIVAGCPARPIKKRFTEDIINKLLDSQWWELPEEQLSKISHEINNPEGFLASLESSNK